MRSKTDKEAAKKEKAEKKATNKAEKKVGKKTGKKDKKNSKNKYSIESSQAFSPIRDIRDGIIITKNRTFVKIIEVNPINFMLRSDAEKNSIIYSFATTLKTMPIDIQFKIVTHKADVNKFLSLIDKDMDTEENYNCRVLQNQQKDLIKRVGSHGSVSRRFFVIFKHEEPVGLKKSSTFDEIKYELRNAAVRTAANLTQCGNEATVLDDDEDILEVLHSIMCKGEHEEEGFETRRTNTIINYLADSRSANDDLSYIPANEFICPSRIDTMSSHKYMIIDGVYYTFAYIPGSSYPPRTIGGWLSMFINMGEGVDVDLFIHKEPSEAVLRKLQYALNFNNVKAKSSDDSSVEFDELRNSIQAGYYLKQGLASGDDFCNFMILLTITGSSLDELEWKVQEIKKFMVSHDFKLKVANFQQEECYKMSLPLCYLNKNIFNKAKRNALSSALASAYPFVSFEVSDPNGILWGLNKANSSLVFVDNFNTKVYKNANMTILGTSGAGKTFSLQCMALRMREKKIQVFIIAPDKGHEFKRACDAIGGEYIKINAGSAQTINVMEIRKRDMANTEIIDGISDDSVLARKIQQLHTFFSLMIPDISNEERQLVDEAIVETYRRFGMTYDNNSLYAEDRSGNYKTMPVLGDLHKVLGEMGDSTRRIYNIVSRYVSGSISSFNKQTNVNLENKYIVLDVSELSAELLSVGMFIVLDYVWDKAREDRTARKAIFLDELWRLIGEKSSAQAAEFVLEIFKVIRGYGGSAIAATQDINDFFALEDGKYGKGIINNAKIKYVLQLEREEMQRVQQILGLSDTEAQQIMHLNRGEGLLAANTNHILVDFKASEAETRLITTDRALLQKIADEHKLNNAKR